MQHDDVLWAALKKGHCSYKRKVKPIPDKIFCANEYNLMGICSHRLCPLANSRYATVLEKEGRLYLFVKVIERVHMPNRTWERIRLPLHPKRAAEAIDKELQWWPSFVIAKCKARQKTLRSVILRARRFRVKEYESGVAKEDEYERVHRKTERRLAAREAKAFKMARLESGIEAELMARLHGGAYDSVVDKSAEFQRVLRGMVQDEMAAQRAPVAEPQLEREIEFEAETTPGMTQTAGSVSGAQSAGPRARRPRYEADFDDAADLEATAPPSRADVAALARLAAAEDAEEYDEDYYGEAGSDDDGDDDGASSDAGTLGGIESDDDLSDDDEVEERGATALRRGRSASAGKARGPSAAAPKRRAVAPSPKPAAKPKREHVEISAAPKKSALKKTAKR